MKLTNFQDWVSRSRVEFLILLTLNAKLPKLLDNSLSLTLSLIETQVGK